MPSALRFRTRAPVDGAPLASTWLPGPPLRLPGVVDRIAEGWWRLTSRGRTVLAALAVSTLLTAVLLRVALAPYGPPVTVLVTTADLEVGAALLPADVATARWPRDLLPPAALMTRADMAGALLAQGVTAGTVLTARHVRDDGPLAALAAGTAAVPVPLGLLRGADGGTHLDLVTVLGDGTGRTIARDVRVLAVDDDTVWLEVSRDRAPDVAAAVLRGTLSGAVLAQ
jgi:Flp pilus assembly protein CpaB